MAADLAGDFSKFSEGAYTLYTRGVLAYHKSSRRRDKNYL